jgi:hypothetical protein
MNDDSDDFKFYWMVLDPEHVGDLLLDASLTIGGYLAASIKLPSIGYLIGIVSQDDGGIIGYAIGEEHANMIVKALNG